MKTKLLLWCATGLLVALTGASAATHYVDAASTNAVPPFTNWTTAASNIQDAVDAAAPGEEIMVTNGVYQTGAQAVYGMSNRVAVTKPVAVRSVNGPAHTSIVGHGPIGDSAIRCAYLTNGAVLAGFTLTNGATQTTETPEMSLVRAAGGGVWSESRSNVVTNCVLVGNSASHSGGGAYRSTLLNCTVRDNLAYYGGGSYFGTLTNCTLTSNSAYYGGGSHSGIHENCKLTGNSASYWGGGSYGGTLSNCKLTRNSASQYGGGSYYGRLNKCTLTGNSAAVDGGGSLGSTLNNCSISGNSAGRQGGGVSQGVLNNCALTGNMAPSGGGSVFCTLNNCTLTGNSSSYFGGGTHFGTLNNCIVYHNSAPGGANYYLGSAFNYCSTTPDPGNGVGNITNAPLFVDTNGWSNLRHQSNSPCINAGNSAYVIGATDLDGLPRIAGGTVDIGAYEFQSPASMISYAWLQQFGLPTDGSADYVDTDHDAHNNWQEWVAGTNPTNALSVLSLASPVITPTNVTLTWTSVANRTYTLEQATNLGDAPAFSVLRSNLAGLPGTTSWTDTNAPVSSPRFYQLRVSP